MKEGVYDHPLMRVEVTKDRVFVYIKDPMATEVGYCMVNQYGDTGTMLCKVNLPKPTIRVGEGELTKEEQVKLDKLEAQHVRGAITEQLVRKH